MAEHVEIKKKKSVYQTGTVSSLVSGVYEGDVTVEDLKQFGDFGLGTPDLVHGEMIIDQGIVHCADEHGHARVMKEGDKTPFSVVTSFESETTFLLDSIDSFDALEKKIDEQLPHFNCIYAIRISGAFDAIKARSECAQPRPFKPLTDTLPKLQTVFEWSDICGTMVAFRFPEHLSSVNVEGYHLHFIEDNYKRGGHVFALSASSPLKVEICQVDRLIIDAIDHPCFRETTIFTATNEHVKGVEKIKE